MAKKTKKPVEPENIITTDDGHTVSKKELKNVIIVGKKNVMNYVLASIQTVHNNGNKGKVILKGRGRNTSAAIDAAEVLKRKYGFEIQDITTSTEQYKQAFVSTIDIAVRKV